MWTSLSKKYYLFLMIIFAIGIILGFIFLIYLDESSKDLIFLNINDWLQNLENTNINNIISHILILSSLFILSLFIVGLPLVLFFPFYNGFSLGFTLMTLIDIFGIKGLLYGLIYIIITKGLFLFFSFIFIISLLKINILVFKRIFHSQNISKDNLSLLLKRSLICIAIILLGDIIIYFGGAKLITLFNFLLI